MRDRNMRNTLWGIILEIKGAFYKLQKSIGYVIVCFKITAYHYIMLNRLSLNLS